MNLQEIIIGLKEIAADCDKVTSGNVSHRIANIKHGILNLADYLENYCPPKTDGKWYVTGFNERQQMVEFLNKHKLKPESFKFSDSGIGTPYTIIYYSDKYLY